MCRVLSWEAFTSDIPTGPVWTSYTLHPASSCSSYHDAEMIKSVAENTYSMWHNTQTHSSLSVSPSVFFSLKTVKSNSWIIVGVVDSVVVDPCIVSTCDFDSCLPKTNTVEHVLWYLYLIHIGKMFEPHSTRFKYRSMLLNRPMCHVFKDN